MARLMLNKSLIKDLGRLPSKVRKKLEEFLTRFNEDHTDPSLHLHSLKGDMRDPKVRGANLSNDYRAIVIAPEKGDTYLLMYIDHHDKAYSWAKNKRFDVHGNTCMFQVFDMEEIERVAIETKKKPEAVDYPLNKLSDEELFQAGVPELLIPSIRAIDSDEKFETLAPFLPQDCREVLFCIASGMSLDQALVETLGEIDEKKPESTGDFTGIAQGNNFDLVLIEGEDELREILKYGTLEEWRIFLHPSQQKVVQWNVKGPMNVTGAAGTGKTVALMHRAVLLAKKITNQKEKVLVSTFTTNLSITLKNQIATLEPSVSERIEVTNLNALARSIAVRAGWKGKIANSEDISAIWSDVFEANDITGLLSWDEIRIEFEQLIELNGIETEDKYLSVVRSGRPRISRTQRKALWLLFVEFNRGLKKRDMITHNGIIHQARLAVENGRFPGYRYVLVDEVQDFGLEALRLIKALSPINEQLRNPLTTFGDGHQRIYNKKIPLSWAGIDIRGRSRRLKINYRTSDEIRKWAQGILKGVDIDNLDGEVTNTIGDRSVFNGPKPEILNCKDAKEEAQYILIWIKDLLNKGLGTYDICITPGKPEVKTALTDAGIQIHELRPHECDPGSCISGVRMGTMHRIKGLEYKAVIMACADEKDSLNDIENSEVKDRCLRYVAATRAREYLYITLNNK